MSDRHQPIVTKSSTEGEWRVFCDACSWDKGDYVNPCKVRPGTMDQPWPPAVLIAAPSSVGVGHGN